MFRANILECDYYCAKMDTNDCGVFFFSWQRGKASEILFIKTIMGQDTSTETNPNGSLGCNPISQWGHSKLNLKKILSN